MNVRRISSGVRYLVASIFLCVIASACKPRSEAETGSGTKPTIGVMTYVSHDILNTIQEGLINRLLELGYDKSQIRVINANGEMDKVHAFAKEMVAANYSILVPITTPVSQAIVKTAQGRIPVVYSFVSDPTSIGVDRASNKAPHNVTGISDIINYEGNLRLIRKLLPNAKRIGIIYNASESNSMLGIEECRKLAPTLGFELEEVAVASTAEILNAARLIVDKVDLFYIGGDNTVVSGAAALIKVAQEKNKPVFASDEGSVKGGAIAALSVNYKEFGKQTAELVNRILKGENPDLIPPQRFVGNMLVINRKALSELGIELPDSVKSEVKAEY